MPRHCAADCVASYHLYRLRLRRRPLLLLLLLPQPLPLRRPFLLYVIAEQSGVSDQPCDSAHQSGHRLRHHRASSTRRRGASLPDIDVRQAATRTR